MNEEEADGDDRSAVALHYSIDVETKNHKLTDAERNAMRRMIQLTLGELKTKLQFVLDDPGNAKAVAHIASSSSGRRELSPPLGGIAML
jgi:hypothetical protein